MINCLQTKVFALLFSLLLLQAGQSAAGLIINEIMYDPTAVSDTYGEWFEIYNPDPAVDLQGYSFSDDGGLFTVSSSLLIPAGGYLVFGRRDDQSINGGVPVDYAYGTALYFSNSGETLSILDAGGNAINSIPYGSAGFPAATGASLCYSGIGDNTLGINWLNARDLGMRYGNGDFGTPGSANSAAVPEPASLLLIGSGLLGILSMRRKRNIGY
jgi:hypothetical protein